MCGGGGGGGGAELGSVFAVIWFSFGCGLDLSLVMPLVFRCAVYAAVLFGIMMYLVVIFLIVLYVMYIIIKRQKKIFT